jgi:DNA-binding SARP family transcriptional activator
LQDRLSALPDTVFREATREEDTVQGQSDGDTVASVGAEPDRPDSGAGRAESAPGPNPSEPQRHTLQLRTSPGQASVTIENVRTGQRYEGVTPTTFEVPPGLYMWTVEKDGYVRQESRQAIDLQTQQRAADTIRLTAVSSEGNRVERGDRAYRQGNVAEAIRFYEGVSPPGPAQDDTYYLRTRARLGELYWKERGDYQSAVEAYTEIVERDPTRYEAFLNLARVSFEREEYGEALNYLDRVSELKYQTPRQRRFNVSLEVKYLRALALYEQANSAQTNARRASKGQLALSALRGFIDTVPPDLESEFREELDDANAKLNEVRELLKTTN